jgi:hypothetical protein
VAITKDPEGKLLSKSKYRAKMKTVGGILQWFPTLWIFFRARSRQNNVWPKQIFGRGEAHIFSGLASPVEYPLWWKITTNVDSGVRREQMHAMHHNVIIWVGSMDAGTPVQGICPHHNWTDDRTISTPDAARRSRINSYLSIFNTQARRLNYIAALGVCMSECYKKCLPGQHQADH